MLLYPTDEGKSEVISMEEEENSNTDFSTYHKHNFYCSDGEKQQISEHLMEGNLKMF